MSNEENAKFEEQEEEQEDQLRLGLIAQEVLEVFPQLVKLSKDGYYQVSYTDLIPVLLKAVLEINERNDRLEDEILFLKNQFSQLHHSPPPPLKQSIEHKAENPNTHPFIIERNDNIFENHGVI